MEDLVEPFRGGEIFFAPVGRKATADLVSLGYSGHSTIARSNIADNNSGDFMKSVVLLGAMLIGFAVTAAANAAEAVSPDIFQVSVPVTIPANNSGVQGVSVVTTPSNKRLVIQSVSFYRIAAPSGSSASVFVATTIFDNLSYWAVPEVYLYSDGIPFPATTQSATFYAGAGTKVFINAYRTGSLAQAETLWVAVSGYYVAKP